MPVSNQTPVDSYISNGSTVEYPFNFKILAEADLKLYYDGVEQLSGFSITGVGEDEGGSVVLDVSPADEVIVRIQREVELNRETDYVEGGLIPTQTLDDDFDRLVMLSQDINTATFKESPDAKWNAQNKIIKDLKDPVDPQDAVTKTYVDVQIDPKVLAAQQAQTAAELAETNALTSETNASLSETNAANSAAAALVSESNAASSAAAALVSETNAASATTFENLDLNGDVGTASDQVAQGDHLHTGVYEPVDADILRADITANLTTGFTTDTHNYGSVTTLQPDLTKPFLQYATVTGNLTINAPSQEAGACLIRLVVDASGPYAVSLGSNLYPIGYIPDLEASKTYECKIVKHYSLVVSVEIVEIKL